MKLKLAPSILNANFAALGNDIGMLERGGAHWLHLDVMDNHFVPNMTFGPSMAKSMIDCTAMPAEAHLMVKNPGSLLKGFAMAGCKRIIVHPEGELHLHRILQTIESLGVNPAVVINPGTPVSIIEPILHMVDMVLVMTVNPGFGGQKFINSALAKVSHLKKFREERGMNFMIEVDGGVNKDTIKDCAQAGADMFVIGSAIFGAKIPEQALDEYMTMIKCIEKEINQ
jgi:ribulose-phosphate 3-epimerase